LVVIPIWIVIFYFAFAVKPEITGDLGALGEIPFGNKYVQYLNNDVLKDNRVVEYNRKLPSKVYEVVSVGDSFSQREIEGYQNYLAHKLDCDVLNIRYLIKSPEQNAIDLLNSGFLKRKGAKILIVETAERAFFRRLKDLDFSIRDYSKDSFEVNTKTKDDNRPLLNRTTAWIRLIVNYQNPVKHARLTKNFFHHDKYSSDLFFYYEDLNFENITTSELELCHGNLFKLDSLCKENGIKLIYLMAAIKYDVYKNYFVDKRYKTNPILQTFSTLDKTDFFVNTYNIFNPIVNEYPYDLYKVNDTHWTPVGHKLVANEIYKRIKN